MNLQISRERLIKAIPVPEDIGLCCVLTDNGFMCFSGNQWNERWRWNESFLQSLTDEQLETLYQEMGKSDATAQSFERIGIGLVRKPDRWGDIRPIVEAVQRGWGKSGSATSVDPDVVANIAAEIQALLRDVLKNKKQESNREQ